MTLKQGSSSAYKGFYVRGGAYANKFYAYISNLFEIIKIAVISFSKTIFCII